MTRARAIATSANRRLWLAAVVHTVGRCISLASLLGIAVVATDRIFALHLPMWALSAPPLALGALAAALLAARRRARAGDAAVVLDHALGLHDRVSSALALERADDTPADPFLTLAQRDADRVAGEVSPRHAIPVRFDNWWVVAALALAALIGSSVALPIFDVLGRERRRAHDAALEERRADAADAIAQAQDELRQASAEHAVDAATPEQLTALDELQRELAQNTTDPDDARAKAASRLDDLAQSLEDRAERNDRALDSLARRLDSLPQGPSDSPAKSLEDALRRGDFDDAAESLDNLRREPAPDASESARALEDLARALERAASEGPSRPPADDPIADQPAPPKNTEAFDALREQGLPSDAARELADSPSADELRDALEQQGLSPQQADRLSQQIARENQQRAADDQARQDLRDLARALDQAADDTRQPSSPSPDPAAPKPSDDASNNSPSPEQRDPQQGPAHDVGADKGNQNPSNNQSGRKPADPKRSDDGKPQRQPGENAPNSSPDDNASPSNHPAPDHAPQSQREAQGPGAAQQDEGNRSDSADRESPDAQRPAGFDTTNQPGDRSSQGESNDQAAGRAFDPMRELAQRRHFAQQSREEARRLRDQAERVLDDLSPDERAQLRRLAEQMARERALPPDDFSDARQETADARPHDPASKDDGRVIAEWLTQGTPDKHADAPGTVEAQRRIADAARGAQRAIEEQQTPARYADLLRRYFKRLPDAVERSTPAPSAPDTTTPSRNERPG